MCVCSPPSALLRAGAMTVANRIGVSSGTAIWRGLRAVRATRRMASVISALALRVSAGRRRANPAVLMAVADMIGFPLDFGLGGFGERGAGQPEVNVVERRWPRHEPGGLDSGVGDGGYRLAGRAAVEGNRET